MKNKKSIIIFSSFSLVLVIGVLFFYLKIGSKENKTEQVDILKDISQSEDINLIDDVLEESRITDNEVESVTEEIEINSNTQEVIEATNDKNIDLAENKSKNKVIAKSKQNENETINEKGLIKEENSVKQQSSSQIVQQEKVEVEKTENQINISTSNNEKEKIEIEPVITKKEEYKKNENMINKIKETILSNESEFMMKYGYEIIVDSSIKNQTNQFTFSENRVKSYLPYKFGTIRIYAEDYFVNGQLVMTECYIL